MAPSHLVETGHPRECSVMFSSVLTFPRNRGKLLLHSCGSSAPRNAVQIPHNWCHAGLPLQPCTDPKLVSGNAACVAGWTCSIGLHLCYYQREGLLLSAVKSQKIMRCKEPIFMSRTDPCLTRCLQKRKAQLWSQLVVFYPRKSLVWSFQSPLPPLSNLT